MWEGTRTHNKSKGKILGVRKFGQEDGQAKASVDENVLGKHAALYAEKG